MIQAAKIIGTGFATTGFMGGVFGALILGVAINLSLRGELLSPAILWMGDPLNPADGEIWVTTETTTETTTAPIA